MTERFYKAEDKISWQTPFQVFVVLKVYFPCIQEQGSVSKGLIL